MEEKTQNNTAQVQPNAPYAVAALILGILALLVGCFGVGLVLGIIGLVLANKGQKECALNPDKYKGQGMLKAGKIMSIIAIVFGAISLVWMIIAGGAFFAYFEDVLPFLDF